jgi:hypothetical protein
MPEDAAFVTKRLGIEAKLQQWSIAFEDFMKTSSVDMSPEDIRGTTLLRIQHKGIQLLLAYSFTGGLSLPDEYNDDFETMISLSEFMILDQSSRAKY